MNIYVAKQTVLSKKKQNCLLLADPMMGSNPVMPSILSVIVTWRFPGKEKELNRWRTYSPRTPYLG